MSRSNARILARAAFLAAVVTAAMAIAPASWAAAPTITSFSPTSGSVGTTVTINGTNLRDATAVRFNGTPATFDVNGFSKITTRVPAGATTGPISVTTREGTATSSSDFTVTSKAIPAPVISSFSPTSGPVGTSVTINGTNFRGSGFTTTSVRFSGVSASFTVNSSTKITATVPAGATTGKISVTTPGGTDASDTSFTVTTGGAKPTISSFSPKSGPVGTLVTINGTNFSGATSVKFSGVAASFSVISSTKITATVPSGATTGRISVTTPAGTATSSTRFTVTTAAKPTISSFSPTSGPVGTSVTINGKNFSGTGFTTTSVKFNGVAASFVVNSSTKITATVPSGATSGKISVTTPNGTATSSTAFTVTGPRHARRVSLELRRHLRVSGTVTVADGFAACASGVPVLIQRHPLNSGTWRTILRLSTQTSGAFGAHVRNRSGRYRARATKVTLSGGDICGRATSEIERYHR